MKPRILMVIDRPGWAFDHSAQHLARKLTDEFEFRFLYVAEQLCFDPQDYDLIHVFFWGEQFHTRFQPRRNMVLKEISSHRWEFEEQYGRVTPSKMVDLYLQDAHTILTTSQRLYDQFEPYVSSIYYCRNGFDTDIFYNKSDRVGSMVVGWAGNEKDPKKGIKQIIRPACQGRFNLVEAGGSLSHLQMPEFYNKLDVFLVGAWEEGEPLTLIEAMASGCFPICTDVGIVPELIENGRNGFIVDRSIHAFQEAVIWCENNLEYVRAQGAENAERMLRSRAWDVVIDDWRIMYQAALSRAQKR